MAIMQFIEQKYVVYTSNLNHCADPEVGARQDSLSSNDALPESVATARSTHVAKLHLFYQFTRVRHHSLLQ
jgi:hypothetical protein